MTVASSLAIFALGLGVLYVGVEAFLKGAVSLARTLGISRLAIGLTLVAFGTSAPELTLDLTAAMQGKVDLAFGDLVGSNIANVGLILGAGALIRPLAVHRRLLRAEVPIVIGTSLALIALAIDGEIGRADGALLLAGFAGFLCLLRRAGRSPALAGARSGGQPPGDAAELDSGESRARRLRSLLLPGAGIVGLVLGARLMVSGAAGLARALGASELTIGLTIVAAGTSLPELATSIAGALRGHADIVVGNVVGSNIFNILFIMGAVALVQPLPVATRSLALELPAMAAFTVALLLVLARRGVAGRVEGACLIAAYGGFVVLLVQSAPLAGP